MPVKVEGVQELTNKTRRISQAVFNVLSHLVDETANVIATEAKIHVPVDTGALRASIEGGLDKASPELIEGHASAGSDKISRGQEPYTWSSKENRKVTKRSTLEYATIVNNKTPYMDSAFKRGQDFILRKAIKELKAAMNV